MYCIVNCLLFSLVQFNVCTVHSCLLCLVYCTVTILQYVGCCLPGWVDETIKSA